MARLNKKRRAAKNRKAKIEQKARRLRVDDVAHLSERARGVRSNPVSWEKVPQFAGTGWNAKGDFGAGRSSYGTAEQVKGDLKPLSERHPDWHR